VPRVFDHVTIRASDRGASEQFYATVLAPLGIARTYTADDLAEWDDFSLASADADNPVTRRLHIAWLAPSRELVDEFWRVGTSAGYRDDGAPGERPQYSPDYYGAFLLDPDGNSAEAVHHGEPHTSGHVDHLWIRVADVAAARRFYASIGPYAGFEVGDETPDRVTLVGGGASFSVVAGEAVTEHVHLASRRGRTARCRRSTAPRSTPATATTAPRVSARFTTPGTTARSCSTRTATTSRWSTTAGIRAMAHGADQRGRATEEARRGAGEPDFAWPCSCRQPR
jgi:catechol 2,3-dioxygenase-like lactoylglutathione lyase family enzyme